jgi:Icc protein
MRTSVASGLRILHLSDMHLTGDGSLHYGMVDTLAALDRVLDWAAELDAIDLVVVSGDLSEDGSEASYRVLRELIEPWAAARGAVVAYVMGNHDDRDGFERVLGDREGIMTVAGFRVVRLDTSVPDRGFGELASDQLDWLRRELSEPAAHGTIIVMHHPPIPANTALLACLELQNPGELLAICSMADVRLILSGHYHHALSTEADGIPVIVAPGIANITDVLVAAGSERATFGSGFALIDIPAGGAVRSIFAAVPGPDDGKEIFTLDAASVQHIAREAGPRP